MLLLHYSRGVLGLLLRVLEVVTAAACRLTPTALHEVILSGHALTHGTARRGLLRAQDDAASVGDDGRKLPGVI